MTWLERYHVEGGVTPEDRAMIMRYRRARDRYNFTAISRDIDVGMVIDGHATCLGYAREHRARAHQASARRGSCVLTRVS